MIALLWSFKAAATISDAEAEPPLIRTTSEKYDYMNYIQLIGKGKALELMCTAEMISADEALNLGLVNYVSENKEDMLKQTDFNNEFNNIQRMHSLWDKLDYVNVPALERELG